jgi:hypothetical protein
LEPGFSSDIVSMTKSTIMGCAGHVACMVAMKNLYKIFDVKTEGMRPIGEPRHKWEDTIKMTLKSRI